MRVYTENFDFTQTIPNDIREGQPSVFVEAPVVDASSRIVVERSLDVPTTFVDGSDSNYKRSYNKDVFSAPTTAGYTKMKQTTFATKYGVIYGYQTK